MHHNEELCQVSDGLTPKQNHTREITTSWSNMTFRLTAACCHLVVTLPKNTPDENLTQAEPSPAHLAYLREVPRSPVWI